MSSRNSSLIYLRAAGVTFMLLLCCLVASMFVAGCKDEMTTRGKHLRKLVSRVGVLQLPYTYDMVNGPHGAYMRSQADTAFVDEELIGGVLPDTSEFYAIMSYRIGDDLFPFISTFDKNGELIDKEGIGISAAGCSFTIIDVDTCIDRVTISGSLNITSTFKLVGTLIDSAGNKVRVCDKVTGKGKVLNNGRIEYLESRLDCE